MSIHKQVHLLKVEVDSAAAAKNLGGISQSLNRISSVSQTTSVATGRFGDSLRRASGGVAGTASNVGVLGRTLGVLRAKTTDVSSALGIVARSTGAFGGEVSTLVGTLGRWSLALTGVAAGLGYLGKSIYDTISGSSQLYDALKRFDPNIEKNWYIYRDVINNISNTTGLASEQITKNYSKMREGFQGFGVTIKDTLRATKDVAQFFKAGFSVEDISKITEQIQKSIQGKALTVDLQKWLTFRSDFDFDLASLDAAVKQGTTAFLRKFGEGIKKNFGALEADVGILESVSRKVKSSIQYVYDGFDSRVGVLDNLVEKENKSILATARLGEALDSTGAKTSKFSTSILDLSVKAGTGIERLAGSLQSGPFSFLKTATSFIPVVGGVVSGLLGAGKSIYDYVKSTQASTEITRVSSPVTGAQAITNRTTYKLEDLGYRQLVALNELVVLNREIANTTKDGKTTQSRLY